jgi:hypothetical protein
MLQGESSCGQADSLLVSRPLKPRQKVLLWTLTFLLDLTKLMYEEEEEKCTFLMVFVLAQSKLSFDPKLLNKSYRTNKDTTNFLFY